MTGRRWKLKGMESVFTREQMIAAGWTDSQLKQFCTEVEIVPKPAWDGVGLPPVGTMCWYGESRDERRIITHIDQGGDAGKHRFLAVGQVGETGGLVMASEGKWKLILADEREVAVTEMESYVKTGLGLRALCEQLYDADYRKQVKS